MGPWWPCSATSCCSQECEVAPTLVNFQSPIQKDHLQRIGLCVFPPLLPIKFEVIYNALKNLVERNMTADGFVDTSFWVKPSVTFSVDVSCSLQTQSYLEGLGTGLHIQLKIVLRTSIQRGLKRKLRVWHEATESCTLGRKGRKKEKKNYQHGKRQMSDGILLLYVLKPTSHERSSATSSPRANPEMYCA